MSETLIGEAEKRFIIAGAECNIRNDGRQRHDIRRVDIQLGVISNATGSARVRIGGTDVIVAVKAEIGVPEADRPDGGTLAFQVECSPVAHPSFRGRGGEELSLEITNALQRSMYCPPTSTSSAQPIDLGVLKIVSGKTCWILYIDALILDLDGAALEATSVAVKAALADAKIPKVEVVEGEGGSDDEPEYELDDDPEQALRLDISKVPISLSMCLLGNAPVVDPTSEEEESARAVIHVAIDPQGTVCGITKRNWDSIDPTMLIEVITLAQRLGKDLHKAVDAHLMHVMT